MKELTVRRGFIRHFIDEVRGVYGNVPKFIHTTTGGGANYSSPSFDDDELTAIIDSVLFGTWLSAGESVRAFEKEFSRKFEIGDSVMVNSGSSANLVMMSALKEYNGWRDGAEIILSVVGFPTTLSAVMLNGLKPVFTDIEFDTLNFNVNEVSNKISTRTQGIFVSPVLGNPPDMDYLTAIEEEAGIELILDDCDSLGTKWGDHYLSSLCSISSCSFYPSHHITTGEGGMVSSDRHKLMKIVRSMVSWGRDCTCSDVANLLPEGSCKKRFDKWLPEQDVILDHKYIFSHTGYNLKPLDLQGAIGLTQLEKFDNIKIARKRNFRTIRDTFLLSHPELKSVVSYSKADVSWFGVPIICPNKEYKVRLVAHLEKNKIQTRNYFAGNILLHPAYKHLGDWREYPMANKVLEQVFFVGCSPNYTDDTLNYICDKIKEFKL